MLFDRNRWEIVNQDPAIVKRLADALGTSELCARLLINRGYQNPDSARAFMEKSDTFLYDPYLLKDIKPAISRICQALEKDEKITIYGDYDVDGVTSVSILYMYLKERGADVNYYIPTRENEGYGVNTAAFQMMKDTGTTLVITVDTGITAIDEIAFAGEIGLDVIVTDHHQCRPELPVCVAVINPMRPDCLYPFKELSGVGVIFKVMCALELEYINCGEYNLFTIKDMCRRYIDLVTIGTIADVMPLFDENRIIVYMGLALLSSSRNIGIRALFHAVGIDSTQKITSSMIGYTIAPRINAAGRIGNAARAVQLFLSTSPHAAEVIAEELCAVNRERQQTENEILTEALLQIEKEHDLEKESVLVLASNHWHPGVIGIVASRITEQFGKPSILISFHASEAEDSEIGRGSARSVKGLNIVEALANCERFLVKYGGHELAAGLSIERKNLEMFRIHLNEYVSSAFHQSNFQATISIDAPIQETDITEHTIREISMLEPFGAKNPEPVFILRDARIVELVPLSAGKHSRLIAEKNGSEIYAVCFGYNLISEGFVCGDIVDIVCNIGVNEFRGKKTLQLIIRDIDHAESFWKQIHKAEEDFDSILEGSADCVSDDIPKRADFAAVYHILRSAGFSSGKKINLGKFLASLTDISYMKARIIFEVLAECELCEVHRIESGIYFIKLTEPCGKKDLFLAPLMKRLMSS